MNKLKLVTGVILVFAVGFLAGTVCTGYYYTERIGEFSGGGPPLDARVRMVLDEVSKNLELSETQRSEIAKILRDAQDDINDLRKTIFPQIEELNENSLELIKEKLDEKQREKFNTFYNRMKNFHDRFAVKLEFPGRPFTPDMSRIKDRLNLTDQQADLIEKIKKDMFQKREKIMKKSTDSQPPDFSKIRQQMDELDKQEQESIKNILNEEQKEAYQKYLDERRFRMPLGPGGPGGYPSNGPDRENPGSPDRPDGPMPPPNW